MLGQGALFDHLAKNLPAGLEDTFTALLASVADLVPAAGREILRWVVETTGAEGLDPDAGGSFRRQSFDVHFGGGKSHTAAPDMVFATDRWEVWFEHKIDAPVGVRNFEDGVEGQLEFYAMGAEERVASGEVDRVYLVLCTRDPKKVPTLVLDENVHFLHNEGRSLRWADLHARLERLKEQGLHEPLLDELLAWWPNLERMYAARAPEGWDAPQAVRERDGNLGRLEAMWQAAMDDAMGVLPPRRATLNRKGKGFYLRGFDHPALYQLAFYMAKADAFPGLPRDAAVLALRVTWLPGLEPEESWHEALRAEFSTIPPKRERDAHKRVRLRIGVPLPDRDGRVESEDVRALVSRLTRWFAGTEVAA